MTESDLAALYRSLGHPVFRLCIGVAPHAPDAHVLLRAVFRACVGLRSPPDFEGMKQLVARGAGRGVEETEDVSCALYLAGALSAEARRSLEAQLSRTANGQVRLAVQRSERASFYASAPPEVFARGVASGEPIAAGGASNLARSVGGGAPMAAVSAGAQVAMPAEEPAAAAPRSRIVFVALALVVVAGVWVALRRAPTPPATIATPSATPTAAAPGVTGAPAAAVAPAAAAPAVARPASAPASSPTGERLMATFDFGETRSRVSMLDGRSRKKSVPVGTAMKVRAYIPEPGYVAVLAQEGDVLRVITPALKVGPAWRTLTKLTIDHSVSVLVVFSRDPLPDSSAAMATQRSARLDLSIDP